MKPVTQTVRGLLGNCFAACVASVTELPLEVLPNHFTNEDGDVAPRWLDEWNEFLKPYGLGMIWADAMFCRTPAGYSIAEMEVKDHNSNHAVVCLDGEIVHDPLGEGYQFARFVSWYVFTNLNAGNLTSTYQAGLERGAAECDKLESVYLAKEKSAVAQADGSTAGYFDGKAAAASELGEAIRSLITASQPTPVEGWQPIASAPKGAVSVLLGSVDCEIVETGYAEFTESLCTEGHKPNRWQPLPAPPIVALTEARESQ